MLMKARISVYLGVLLLCLTVAIGCNKAPNDAQIGSEVQNKLNSDSGLQGKQLNVQSADGTVTLSGNVDSDGQRQAAARYAASVPGVKQVVNNLQVGAPPPMAEATPAPTPTPESVKPAPSRARRHSSREMKNMAKDDTGSAPPPPPAAMSADNSVPAAPPPPPPPVKLTIPSGTTLAVRLVDTIDSEAAQPGQPFHATLHSPLAVEGETGVPAGHDVEGAGVD